MQQRRLRATCSWCGPIVEIVNFGFEILMRRQGHHGFEQLILHAHTFVTNSCARHLLDPRPSLTRFETCARKFENMRIRASWSASVSLSYGWTCPCAPRVWMQSDDQEPLLQVMFVVLLFLLDEEMSMSAWAFCQAVTARLLRLLGMVQQDELFQNPDE